MERNAFRNFLQKDPAFRTEVRRVYSRLSRIPEREGPTVCGAPKSRIDEAEWVLFMYFAALKQVSDFIPGDKYSHQLHPLIQDFVKVLLQKYPQVLESPGMMEEAAAAFAHIMKRGRAGRKREVNPSIERAAEEFEKSERKAKGSVRERRREWERFREIAAPPGSVDREQLQGKKRSEDRRHPAKARLNKRIERAAKLHSRMR